MIEKGEIIISLVMLNMTEKNRLVFVLLVKQVGSSNFSKDLSQSVISRGQLRIRAYLLSLGRLVGIFLFGRAFHSNTLSLIPSPILCHTRWVPSLSYRQCG